MWVQAHEELKAVPHTGLQMPFHGGYPAGTTLWLKNLDRWTAGLCRQRFLPIPARR
jgi:hypothetical protein